MKPYIHFDEEIAKEICREISTTHLGIKRLCKLNPHWPCAKSIYGWLVDNPTFLHQYRRAREYQSDWLAEDALEVAYDGSQDSYVDDRGHQRVNHEVVQRSRLIVDTIKWTTAIVKPRVYGDQAGKEDAEKKLDDLKSEMQSLKEVASKCLKSI